MPTEELSDTVVKYVKSDYHSRNLKCNAYDSTTEQCIFLPLIFFFLINEIKKKLMSINTILLRKKNRINLVLNMS